MYIRKLLLLALACLLMTQVAFVHPTSTVPPSTKILLIGTHHMPHDVLRKSRQKEVDQFVGALSRFMPDKILFDLPYQSPEERLLNDNFQSYLSGAHPLNRSLEEQIGFRLAALMQHEYLYGVDECNSLNLGLRIQELQQQGAAEGWQQWEKTALKMERQKQFEMANEPLDEYFAYLNGQELLKKEHSLHVQYLSRMGSGMNVNGPSLLADWYGQHVQIFGHLTQVAEKEDERLILFVDAKKIPILEELIQADPQFEIVSLSNFIQLK